jgi:two-component system sensor histidine kinase CpxA
MHSLYLRLLVLFTIVLLLSVGAFWRAYLTVSGPAMQRMIGGAQAAQADEAAAAVRRGGAQAGRDYLARLDGFTRMQHHLVDPDGRDVLTAVDRSALIQGATGQRPSRPRVEGDHAIFVTASSDDAYRLVTIAPLPFTFRDLAPHVGLILGGVAVLFWLVVAHVVNPLRRLEQAVHRFGRGEFAVRAPIKRRDEIGRLAEAFNDMARRIEMLVTAERRLLQDVSHELRSPLTRLNLAIELSRTAVDRNEAADRLQRDATRLSDLVSTLLEVVRLEGDPGSAMTGPVKLMDVLYDSVENGASQAESRDVKVAISGTIDGTIDGNAELLRRAFDNVIGNATRYAPPGSVVTVSCNGTTGEHVIEVRDTGSGVEENQLAKLGNPFYRTDESRSADTGGVGLGLAIARRAIHLHRGSVHFANANPGLRVTMRLPARAA